MGQYSIIGTVLLGLLLSFLNQDVTVAFVPSHPTEFLATLFAGERGELTVSEPYPLDPILVEAAKEVLPWEQQQDAGEDSTNCDEWKQGQVWHETRIKLTNLWVLPRDMSNGAWDAYAVAASSGEQKILNQVPQLLRIDTEAVVASAKTVLTTLSLPPALLRKEPMLLTIDSKCLVGGFKTLQNSHKLLQANTDTVAVLEACRDTPGLLFDAAIAWKNHNRNPQELL